jgi:hypothetical protein
MVHQDTGEVLRSLDIHIFIITDVGQLGPKGDVQRQGLLQSPVHIAVGHDRHGRSQEISGNGHGILAFDIKFEIRKSKPKTNPNDPISKF